MVHEHIYNRKSIVCFDEKPVPPQVLKDIFEAASLAPSANNQQPWRYLVGVKGTTTYTKIFDSLKEGNQEWAGKAPVLIASIAEVVSSYNRKTNIHAWHDTALSFSNLIFEATSRDLFVHPMAGFYSENLISAFKIPIDFQPVVVAAIGYRGDCKDMSESIRQRENKQRIRKPLDEFIFDNEWGKSFKFKV